MLVETLTIITFAIVVFIAVMLLWRRRQPKPVPEPIPKQEPQYVTVPYYYSTPIVYPYFGYGGRYIRHRGIRRYH